MSSVARGQEPRDPAVGVPRWPAMIALLAIAGLFAFISDRLTIVPSWLLLVVVVAVLLSATIAGRLERHVMRRRIAFIGLGIITVIIITSAILLVRQLFGGGVPAVTLLFGAASIWVANCGIFAVWYWEIDGGGPGKRRTDGHISTDFLFPQLQVGDGTSSGGWWPGFIDYLFVAWNASTAFSPTDTLILSRRAKVLMMIQSLVALVTVAVLAARAINTIQQ
jgi:hypothetical protein